MLHSTRGFGVADGVRHAAEYRNTHARTHILFRFGDGEKRFQRCLVTPVAAPLAAFVIDFDVRLRARPMEVQIRIEVLAIEALNRFGVRRSDMTIAHVLANHCTILGFH